MMILTNALGISDSGGITVLDKYLEELTLGKNSSIVCYNQTKLTDAIVDKFKNNRNLIFLPFEKKGFFQRFWLEHFVFKKLIAKYNVEIIYNFSGSAQFLPIIQIIKLQNLMFYSKNLDDRYKKAGQRLAWIKQIFIKRFIFLQLYRSKKYFEVQSSHVIDYFLNFTNEVDRKFYIKSDVRVAPEDFLPARQYNFNSKISIFYIVGPHFIIPHKNFKVFVEAMLLLKKKNIDFEIIITLSEDQLNRSELWDKELNHFTNFLGYITHHALETYFRSNTILVSTSVIETLGLHVIEAVKHGCVALVPNEHYSTSVYGNSILQFKTDSFESLVQEILKLTKMDNRACQELILKNQRELKYSEETKMSSVNEIFNMILKEND